MTRAEHVMQKLALTPETLNNIKSLVAGAGAGAITGMAVMPLDVISDTQKQWRNTRNDKQLNEVGKSFTSTAKELYRPKVRENADGGIGAFYAGAGGKMTKIIPNSALMFAVNNKLQKVLKVAK